MPLAQKHTPDARRGPERDATHTARAPAHAAHAAKVASRNSQRSAWKPGGKGGALWELG